MLGVVSAVGSKSISKRMGARYRAMTSTHSLHKRLLLSLMTIPVVPYLRLTLIK
jgi:hypothetical protein